jgi:uncharacterized RDD family membrane protein YckC
VAKRPARYQPQQMRMLETPEGVKLAVEIASVGTRMAAFFIDMVLICGAMITFTIITLATGIDLTTKVGDTIAIVNIFWLITIFVLRNFWFILFEMGPRGATPGKRWMGLRVIARGGGRLEAGSVVARNLLREVELFLPLGFMQDQISGGTIDFVSGLLGFGWTMLFLLFPLFNKDRLRAGDMFAGTWVIRAERRDAGHDLLDRTVTDTKRFAFTDEQLAAYGNYELQTLERVLRDDSGQSLALVAETIRTKIGWPFEYDDHAFLSAYYAAVRTRLEKGMLFGKKRLDKYDDA